MGMRDTDLGKNGMRGLALYGSELDYLAHGKWMSFGLFGLVFSYREYNASSGACVAANNVDLPGECLGCRNGCRETGIAISRSIRSEIGSSLKRHDAVSGNGGRIGMSKKATRRQGDKEIWRCQCHRLGRW